MNLALKFVSPSWLDQVKVDKKRNIYVEIEKKRLQIQLQQTRETISHIFLGSPYTSVMCFPSTYSICHSLHTSEDELNPQTGRRCAPKPSKAPQRPHLTLESQWRISFLGFGLFRFLVMRARHVKVIVKINLLIKPLAGMVRNNSEC